MRLHPKEDVVQDSASGIIRRLGMMHVLRPEPAAVAPPAPAPVLPTSNNVNPAGRHRGAALSAELELEAMARQHAAARAERDDTLARGQLAGGEGSEPAVPLSPPPPLLHAEPLANAIVRAAAPSPPPAAARRSSLTGSTARRGGSSTSNDENTRPGSDASASGAPRCKSHHSAGLAKGYVKFAADGLADRAVASAEPRRLAFGAVLQPIRGRAADNTTNRDGGGDASAGADDCATKTGAASHTAHSLGGARRITAATPSRPELRRATCVTQHAVTAVQQLQQPISENEIASSTAAKATGANRSLGRWR